MVMVFLKYQREENEFEFFETGEKVILMQKRRKL
jgi:hypothetical protein